MMVMAAKVSIYHIRPGARTTPQDVLFILGIVDLVVGVSNDAVNFLISAIGCRVAKRKYIYIIAGAGILLGCLFSGSMMEVARNGIFNPGVFYLDQLLYVFLAVMITDILLIDSFNTFGYPTSTLLPNI